uniref:Putative calcineurin-like phosphoesterase n=1 Tax=viral metagenome TaxID=1070528 RepID=A0A6H2A3S0_9ZZZZ
MSNELRWYGKVLPKELTEVKLVIISDLHYGNPYFSYKHFQRTIDFIKNNENTYCFLNGDLCESVIKTSKGEIHKQVGSPDDQKKQVVEWLEPIKDSILGTTTGNHENRIYESAGTDITDYIAEKLNIPYRPEGMLYKLAFGDNNSHVKGKPFVFWIYITHGYGGARTKSSKAVKAERTSNWIHADLVAMAHDHVVNVAPDIYLMPDNRGTIDNNGFLSGKVTAKRKMLVKTNAYLKWGGYAESGGFPPSDLSTPVINLLTPYSEQWGLYPDKPQQAIKVSV